MAAHLEEQKVRGAIKTDFILSAEIMTIALAALETDSIWFEPPRCWSWGLGITALVYGSVALIVKADDIGLHLAREGRSGPGRAAGAGHRAGDAAFPAGADGGGARRRCCGWAVRSSPMRWPRWAGTGPEDVVHTIAHAFAAFGRVAEWLAGAALHGALGVALGAVLISVVRRGGGRARGEPRPVRPATRGCIVNVELTVSGASSRRAAPRPPSFVPRAETLPAGPSVGGCPRQA